MNIFGWITLKRLEYHHKKEAKLTNLLVKIDKKATVSDISNHLSMMPRTRVRSSSRVPYYVAFGSVIAIMICLAPVFIPFRSASAETYTSHFSSSNYYVDVTASTSVTMDLETTSNFATTSAHDNIIVSSNVPAYDIYISTSNDSNALHLNGDTTSSSYLPATTTENATLRTMDDNSWGFSLDDIVYNPVPSSGSETKIYTYNQGTSGSVNTNTYDIFYGVKANNTKESGVYSNSVFYSTVANTSNIYGQASISPMKTNAGNDITIITDLSTMMQVNNVEITINGVSSNVTTTCSSTNITNIDNIIDIVCTLPNDIADGYYNVSVSLPEFGRNYTVNNLSVGSTFYSITSMQQMTPSVCNTVHTPSTSAPSSDTTGSYVGNSYYVPETTLVDSRDGKSYLVRKLADGNCWMSQDLDFVLSASVSLTNADSDLNTKSSWKPAISTQTANGGTWEHPSTTTHSYRIGNVWMADGITRSNTNTGKAYEKLGTLYNWFAATAGSGLASTVNTSVADSVCPKGWQLPLGNSANKSLTYLVGTTYGITQANEPAVRAYPLNFLRGGFYNHGNSTYSDVGTRGNYRTATAGSSNVYDTMLYFYNGYNKPNQAAFKGDGFAVRCVAR